VDIRAGIRNIARSAMRIGNVAVVGAFIVLPMASLIVGRRPLGG